MHAAPHEVEADFQSLSYEEGSQRLDSVGQQLARVLMPLFATTSRFFVFPKEVRYKNLKVIFPRRYDEMVLTLFSPDFDERPRSLEISRHIIEKGSSSDKHSAVYSVELLSPGKMEREQVGMHTLAEDDFVLSVLYRGARDQRIGTVSLSAPEFSNESCIVHASSMDDLHIMRDDMEFLEEIIPLLMPKVEKIVEAFQAAVLQYQEWISTP